MQINDLRGKPVSHCREFGANKLLDLVHKLGVCVLF